MIYSLNLRKEGARHFVTSAAAVTCPRARAGVKAQSGCRTAGRTTTHPEAMKLNILSDLHLSLGALEIPRNDADAVILAGDIARPRDAFSWALAFDKPVLYIPGNHEFYGGSIPGAADELKRLCAGTDIRVLDNDEVVIAGVRFLGTTLWTDFMLFGEGEMRTAAMQQACIFMRDFSRIRVGEAGQALFTPTDSAALFKLQAEWLEGKLSEPHAGPTVVITHHAPSRMSIHPRFAGSLLNACFVSDAERLIKKGRACLWIHGHTHDSFDYVLNGTRVVCNPRGYAKDGTNENPQFDPNFVVEIA
jgi:predicted phosphodiesterase